MTIMIDPDTVGQLVAEGIAILVQHSDVSEGYDLATWFTKAGQGGDALRPLRDLMPIARNMLDDASILNDPHKQLRASVAYDAISGVLSLYGINA